MYTRSDSYLMYRNRPRKPDLCYLFSITHLEQTTTNHTLYTKLNTSRMYKCILRRINKEIFSVGVEDG